MGLARGFLRLALIAYLVVVHAALAYLLVERAGWLGERPATRSDSIPATPSTIAIPVPSPAATADPITVATPQVDVPGTGLIVPVAGVKPEDLLNTYGDARGDSRQHGALDIAAAQGTPVLAAADGTVAMHHDSERGGLTIYQLSEDGHWVFYYAHLQSRADNAAKDARVKRGDVIGYVGDTGNAGAGNYHLHFAIWRITDPKRIWEGENIDPYPILRFGQPLPR